MEDVGGTDIKSGNLFGSRKGGVSDTCLTRETDLVRR